MTTPLSWRARLGLVAFGLCLALVTSIVALQFLPPRFRGTEFNSIDEVRRAMTGNTELAGSEPPLVNGQPVSLRAIVQPHASDRIIYTLKPELDLHFMRARVRTNSCGMRSPERPRAKEAGVFRIALLGDSFAFGWGVEQNESFAQRLEDTLNETYKGSPRVEVLNFGVPGYSTFQEVALFEEIGLDYQPDAVLVYFVENDFGMPFFIRDLNGNGGILSSLKFVQLGRRLLKPDEMDKQIRDLGLDPSHALQRLDTICAEHGIRPYLAINPKKSWKQHLSRLGSVRRGSGITVMPLRDSLMEYVERRNISEKDLTLSFDPHPSPIRHKILGTVMATFFMEKLG